MKKLIALILVTLIAVIPVLSGCGGKEVFSDVTTGYDYYDENEEEEEDYDYDAPLDLYDGDAVLAACLAKDSTELTGKNLSTYEAVMTAIDGMDSNEMSEVEMITYVHDYITTHVTYDLNEMALAGSAPASSSNPYGALVRGQAICMGYTTTFKLFMDVLGIESIVVTGSALGEDHAWNMVNVGGSWYHVDCTWDDYVPDYEGRMPFHTYLLVADSAMDVQHIWDHDSTPSADSTDLVYYFANDMYFELKSDLTAYLDSCAEAGDIRAEVAIPNGVSFYSSIATLDHGTVYGYWNIDLGEYTVVIYYLEDS